jgi:hypothetical protein
MYSKFFSEGIKMKGILIAAVIVVGIIFTIAGVIGIHVQQLVNKFLYKRYKDNDHATDRRILRNINMNKYLVTGYIIGSITIWVYIIKHIVYL